MTDCDLDYIYSTDLLREAFVRFYFKGIWIENDAYILIISHIYEQSEDSILAQESMLNIVFLKLHTHVASWSGDLSQTLSPF